MKNYLRYSYALLAIGIIVGWRYAMVPLIGYGIPYITLFPVTVAVALFAGMGPSIVTGLVGAIIIDYAFIEPLYTIKMDVAHITRTTVVVLTSAFVGYVGSVLRAARIKAEQQARQLRESQEDLHRAQAVGNIGSWRLDVRRNTLTWSDENHLIFGIPKGTPLSYETFLSTVHPDDREYVDTQWKAGLASADYDIEHRLIVDGKTKWVREKAYLEFDKNNELIGGFGITQDITERKQAEEALRQSERLYRGIGEAIDYGVWMCDADGRNTYASESFLKMVGITQQQCSDFGWGNVLHPDDAERTIAAWKECVRTGGNWDIEHRFRGVDGQWHYVLARGVPIRDEQGHITCWAGINLDISGLKQVEEVLQQSETRYRRLFEAAHDGILILNAATGQIIDVNPFLTELLRYSHKDFVGKYLWEIGTFKDIAASKEAFGELQSKGYIRYEDLPLQTHDGQHIDVEFVSNRYSSGNIEVIQCNIRDITVRKQAEDALRENKLREQARLLELERLGGELAYKNEELESIIRIASHDLRSPLMNIKGFSSELAKDIDKVHQMLKELPLPEKISDKAETVFTKYVPEALGFIQNSAEAINRMLKSLMAVAKAGTTPITMKTLDMNALVADIAANCQFRLIESGGVLTIDPLPECRGDADQITQIFSNLIGNAIKYREPKRPLHIHVHASIEEGTVTYCVEDNGRGIDAAHHDKIFDLFTRLDSDATEGEGIGLTIVRRMIERHGGKIRVSSEVGKGSSFFVAMPR